ncbi:hypothetical protein L209DRAFT_759976 [Thermothelomyces heterothallicus CBS 203.75]
MCNSAPQPTGLAAPVPRSNYQSIRVGPDRIAERSPIVDKYHVLQVCSVRSPRMVSLSLEAGAPGGEDGLQLLSVCTCICARGAGQGPGPRPGRERHKEKRFCVLYGSELKEEKNKKKKIKEQIVKGKECVRCLCICLRVTDGGKREREREREDAQTESHEPDGGGQGSEDSVESEDQGSADRQPVHE